MKVCFGVISIGKLYTQEFERLFKPSVQNYCNKFGYDLKVFTTFLDPSHTHPDTISFQKCLVPSFLMDYDLVVVLDADIYIEPNAPAIHFCELHDKIGMVDEVMQSSPEIYKILAEEKHIVDYPIPYYKRADFDLDTTHILNTGLIVCNPKLHAEFLKNIYEKYVDKSVGHPRQFHYEQSCIGYEIQKAELFTILPNAWNFIVCHSLALGLSTKNNFFVHFAGYRSNNREIMLAVHTSKISNVGWKSRF